MSTPTGRPSSSASAPPELHPLRHDCGRVAALRCRARATGCRALRITALTVCTSASTSAASRSRSAGSRTESTSMRSAVSGVRSRWDRSAAVSRSRASSASIRSASRLRPVPTARTSGGPPGRARASRSPAAEPVRHLDDRAERPYHRPGQLVGDQHADPEQAEAEQAEHQPGAADAATQVRRR